MVRKFEKEMYMMLVVFTGLALWFAPVPTGISLQAWHLFAIFAATIMSIILNPVPMGVSALLAISICAVTGTLSLEECLSGFGSSTIWLTVFAFFISLGFSKTGLGSRVAYFFISKVGGSTLGLVYSLVVADFLLSPLIPSVTARGGGIIFPIAQSLCKSYEQSKGENRTAAFIIKVCFQANVITSTMFVTAMAANPLVVKLAGDFGIRITWGEWALAALVPCVLCLMLMPLLLYWIYPPTIKYSKGAQEIAAENLRLMGKMSRSQILMLCTFVLLLFLWIFGADYGISATLATLIGLNILFITRSVNFEDAIADKAAWHTFLWFATLVTISGALSKLGLMSVFGEYIRAVLPQDHNLLAAVILLLVYFYIHYLFASTTAHVTVLYPAFLMVLIGYGIKPMAAALILGFLSVLSGGITHFGLASAPIFFGSNYMKTKKWWQLGFICSLLYLVILASAGILWWKVLGIW